MRMIRNYCVKHCLAFALFAAFLNLWIPAEVFLHFHQHEHTVHTHEKEGVAFENLHHHCASSQFSILLHPLPELPAHQTILNFRILITLFLYQQNPKPILGNVLSRGPPGNF